MLPPRTPKKLRKPLPRKPSNHFTGTGGVTNTPGTKIGRPDCGSGSFSWQRRGGDVAVGLWTLFRGRWDLDPKIARRFYDFRTYSMAACTAGVSGVTPV